MWMFIYNINVYSCSDVSEKKLACLAITCNHERLKCKTFCFSWIRLLRFGKLLGAESSKTLQALHLAASQHAATDYFRCYKNTPPCDVLLYMKIDWAITYKQVLWCDGVSGYRQKSINLAKRSWRVITGKSTACGPIFAADKDPRR